MAIAVRDCDSLIRLERQQSEKAASEKVVPIARYLRRAEQYTLPLRSAPAAKGSEDGGDA